MKITLLTYGSRGDVQPYIALANRLIKSGHSVSLAAPAQYSNIASSYEIDFYPLPGNPAALMADMAHTPVPVQFPWRTARQVYRHLAPIFSELYQTINRSCSKADCVVHSLLLTAVGHTVARQLDIPDMSGLVFPVFVPTVEFPNPLFPDLTLGPRYNRETHIQFNTVFWFGQKILMNWLKRLDPAIPTIDDFPFEIRVPFHSPTASSRSLPIIYSLSSALLPQPFDWDANVHLTGYWFLDPHPTWQPSPEILKFLEKGSKPVYIGFGSIVHRRASDLTRLALEALRITGQRGLISSGWGGMTTADLPAYACKVEEMPLTWLFQHAIAAVHHAGVGTISEALQAGIPSVAVPFMADQLFWAGRIRKLQIGPTPIPAARLTVNRLATAIQLALENKVIRDKVSSFSAVTRAEDGLNAAIQVITGTKNRS